VRVSDAEISALARRLELSDAEFRGMYTRPLRGGDLSLRERRNRDCVFYDREAAGCRVYEDRPRQCRTWPFWDAVIHSRERWREEARSCPGMNRGQLYEAETISASVEPDTHTAVKPPA
jgi:Fe-S-cluster containining protein